MFLELPDTVFGALVLVVLIPLLYFAARLTVRINGAWMAFRAAPLAAAIDGHRDPGGYYLRGRYGGHVVRVSFAPGARLNGAYSNSAHRFINALNLELHEVPGQQDWVVHYRQKQGWLSQGPVYAFLEAAAPELAQRLEQAGVLAAVTAVGGGTTHYETVRYNARQQVLYYTTDVAPQKLPSQAKYRQQLDLLLQLAEINGRVNAQLPAPA